MGTKTPKQEWASKKNVDYIKVETRCQKYGAKKGSVHMTLEWTEEVENGATDAFQTMLKARMRLPEELRKEFYDGLSAFVAAWAGNHGIQV